MGKNGTIDDVVVSKMRTAFFLGTSQSKISRDFALAPMIVYNIVHFNTYKDVVASPEELQARSTFLEERRALAEQTESQQAYQAKARLIQIQQELRSLNEEQARLTQQIESNQFPPNEELAEAQALLSIAQIAQEGALKTHVAKQRKAAIAKAIELRREQMKKQGLL
jgi:hypothetical protein